MVTGKEGGRGVRRVVTGKGGRERAQEGGNR